MKRLLMILLCTTAMLQAFSQRYTIKSDNEDNVSIIEFTLNNYTIKQVPTAEGIFSKIDIGKNTFTEKKGWAELPFISTTVSIYDGDSITIDTSKSIFHDIRLEFPILPSRGTIYRNQNPDSIPYITYEESIKDVFYPENNIVVEDAFYFRTEKKVNIRIFPFQYNAEQKAIRIYDRISVKIIHKTTREAITLPNYDYGDILVITPEKYDSTLTPYIEWKRQMGYNVYVQHCDSAENVKSRIAQTYIQNPNILYVQIVGNWNDIRSEELGTETCYDCPTDPALGCVSGNDNYPDIAIGRFSCNNAEELASQIHKSINYEKNPNNCRDWRERFIGIGSGEGPGDDNELDYEHVSKIYNNKLAQFTYSTHSQHYDYALTGNVSTNALANSINVGSSTIAYCGHGSGSYWLTGGYGSSNVTNSSNGDKLPFVISVACRNGAFHNGECFAEKWMKAKHGGAIATLMSSINQPWIPPMRGQDYFYDILTGGYNYDRDTTSNGLSTEEQRTHWGAIVLNSFYLMLCESAQESDIETVKTWISFGDASIQLRTKTPEKIESSENIIIEGRNYTTKITDTNGNAVKNALVCISQDGNYYKGFTNSRGIVNIGHNMHIGNALLVVTSFNTTTIYDSIPVIEQGKPYIEVTEISPKSINSGTNSNITISLKNLGSTQSDSIRLSISCNDELLTINTDTTHYAPIFPDETSESSEIDIHVASNTPHGHCFSITATIEYNDTIITRDFQILQTGQECYAPDNMTVEYTDDTCTISWNNLTLKKYTIFDDFEDSDAYPPFSINPEGNIGWSYIDGDDSQTGNISGYTFPNNYENMAFITFDPEMAYSESSNLYELIHPYSGKQFLASLRSVSLTTNDWIFSKELDFIGDFEFSFHVRGSHMPNYWETMEVYYISTDTMIRIDSCTIRGSADPDNWTYKSYTIPDTATHVAIRNISRNKNFLCIDDIKISGYKIYSTDGINIYDNGILMEANITGDTHKIYNLEDGEHCFSIRSGCNTNLYTDTTICITVVHEQCDAPENVKCYVGSSSDSLIWNASPNATSYNIYCNETLLANTSDTTFTIDNTESECTYTLTTICRNSESESVEAQTILVGNYETIEYFKVFPNPSNGIFTIETNTGMQNCEFIITDICGRNIKFGTLHDGQNSIDLQAFPDGIYIIRISAENISHKFKIVKQ